MYKRKEGTKIIRGIPQIYNVSKNLKNNKWPQEGHQTENRNLARLAIDNNKTNQHQLRFYVIHLPSSLDPNVFISYQNVSHQIELVANDPFNLIKTKFEFLDIPAKILAFRSCQTQYIVAKKPSLREKFMKALPFQVTVTHLIHSSQFFLILGISHLSQTYHHIALE